MCQSGKSVSEYVCVHAQAQTKRSTATKLGIDIQERVFYKTSKSFFSKSDLDFLKIIFKDFFLFLYKLFIYFTILCMHV